MLTLTVKSIIQKIEKSKEGILETWQIDFYTNDNKYLFTTETTSQEVKNFEVGQIYKVEKV